MLERTILARLLTPATEMKVREDVGKLAGARLTPGEWSAQFEAHWKRLADQGLISRAQGKSRSKAFELTDAGRQKVSEFLQISALPPKLSWAAVQSDYLLPIAMGVTPGSPEARRMKTAASLKLAVISRSKSLPLSQGATAKAVLAALAWKLIGVDDGGEFSAESVIQRLAFGQQATKKMTTVQMTTALAASALGSSRTGAADLRLAAIRQWLAGAEVAQSAALDGDRRGFAARVIDAARRCPAKSRFGDNKVFISHVWRQCRGEPLGAALDADEFKQRLVEANRDGLLELSRADLVEAMDPTDVRESSTVHGNATFHFIRI